MTTIRTRPYPDDGAAAAEPHGIRTAVNLGLWPPPTTSHLDTRRHSQPTQPRRRHRPLNRSGSAWSCRGSPAAI